MDNLVDSKFESTNKNQFKKNIIEFFLSDKYVSKLKELSKTKNLNEDELAKTYKTMIFNNIIDDDIEFFKNQNDLKMYVTSPRYKKKLVEVAKANKISERLVEINFKSRMIDDVIKLALKEKQKSECKYKMSFIPSENSATNIIENNEIIQSNHISFSDTKEEKQSSEIIKNDVDMNKFALELEKQIVPKILESFKKQLDEFKIENNNSKKEIINSVIKGIKNENVGLESTFSIKNTEIREHFLKALRIAKDEIDIISPWVNYYGLDTEVMSLLELALKRGVTIKIIYGIDDPKCSKSKKNYNSEIVVQALKNKFNKYKHLFKIKKSNTHAKLLLCDSSFYIIGSMNLLSFNPDYNEELHSELAEYSENKIMLETYRTNYFNF